MHNRDPADLFQRLPGHFRTSDAAEGRPLQALMELFRSELGIIEADIDQLYDNWFVETCEPWALPYIAELVGARPMRDIGTDQAGLLRAYVANILQYRQAKGTAAVIEQVARDVSGWPVVAVEYFQRLATSQHVNHLRPDAPAFVDVRSSATARASRSPFSTLAHSAAAGAPAGWAGRYNIPHLGLHVWRHSAAPIWPVSNAAAGYLGGPFATGTGLLPGQMRFDPMMRDLPLVNRPAADLSIAARMGARMVPAPLDRDTLFAMLNAARDTGVTPDRWFEDAPPFRIRLDGVEVAPANLFCCDLSDAPDGTWRSPAQAGDVLVDPVLGRISLHPDDIAAEVETGFAQASAFDIGGGAYERRESLDQWLPDLVIEGESAPWQIGVSKIAADITDNPDQGGPVVGTMREAVRRWNAFAGPGARGIIVMMDNASYVESLNGARTIQVPPGARLAIVAGGWPDVPGAGGVRRRTPGQIAPMHRRPWLRGPVTIAAADAGEDEAGQVIIDGLVVANRVQTAPTGDLGALRLFNATLGARDHRLDRAVSSLAGNARLRVQVHRCVIAGLDLPVATGPLQISRSLVGEDRTADGAGNGALVIKAPLMDTDISASTVIGRATLRSIAAENSILTGAAQVAQKQTGCVRFCWTAPGSALPRRYRCQPLAGTSPVPRPVFVSTRFQDGGFGQLNMCTPDTILEGAEDGMEMGVGFANRDPARRANIVDALAEFAPLGQTPGIIFES